MLNHLGFSLLTLLSKASPPLSKRRAERFARSAAKRDPRLDTPLVKAEERKARQLPSALSAPISETEYLAVKQQVLGSIFWDEHWYLSQYFKEFVSWRTGLNANNTAVDHYIQIGWRYGYKPSRIFTYRAPKINTNPISYLLNSVWPNFHFEENVWIPEQHQVDLYVVARAKRISKKVIYCCIIDGYDALTQPYHINSEWDYVCYTDDQELIKKGAVGVWQIIEARHPMMRPDLRNRYHKMHPHNLFPDHEESIYIDGNVNIISSFLFDEIRRRSLPILIPMHFSRNCIYEEIINLLGSRRTSEENRESLLEQVDFLRKVGFPDDYGLNENNVIYRVHHNEAIKRIMMRWWDLLRNFSSRDQAALSYVFWLEGIDPEEISFPNTRSLNTDFWVFAHESEKPKVLQITVDKKIRPAFPEGGVPVVLSCNESFVGYLGVVLTSLIENASNNRNYDIIILETDISEKSKEIIKKLGKHNVAVRFYNMTATLSQLESFDVYVTGYVPVETYNKMFLNEIMSGFEKIIYIDTDIVIRCDIAELFDIDLFGKALGASQNVANIHAARMNTKIRGRKFGDYLLSDLDIKKFDHYFQAGIIVLDMKNDKIKNLLSLSLNKLAELKEPIFFDQCIFNSIFYGDVFFFSTTWNHVWYLQSYSHLKHTLTDNLFFDYAKSRLNPKIIHYASGDKPTNRFDWRLGSHFWNYLQRSPFADALMEPISNKRAAGDLSVPSLECLCSEPKPRILIHLHVFHFEQLDYMLDKLENIKGGNFDLVVTASENFDTIAKIAKEKFELAETIKVKNKGFDVYPFLKVLQAKNLSHYDYVLKLHTKNARPVDESSKVYGISVPGYKWRDDLMNAILGSEEIFKANLKKLENNPSCGGIAASQYIFTIEENQERITYRLRHWMNKFGIEAGEHYVGGTMFMARAYPFERFKVLNPDELDFLPGDSTSGSHKNLAHVFERLLGLAVETEGLTFLSGSQP